MSRYSQVLSNKSGQYLLISSFPARLAYGMISLSIFFKVQQSTGSIAIAGLATGVNGITGATTAGLRGTLIDKFGMKIPLRFFAPGYALLILLFSTGSTKTELVLFAGLLGFSAPPINLSIRPLWKVTVPKEQIRTAYAIDTAVMNSVGVFGPLVATTVSLNYSPQISLRICSILILVGGAALSMSPQLKKWKPEKKSSSDLAVWRTPAMQLLMCEGVFIGLGWGAFDIAIPAFTTLENIAGRTGVIFAIMAAGNVIGGLVAGMVSKRTSSFAAFKRIYFYWFIFSLPLAFTYPDWSMMIVTAVMSLMAGGLQVFYLEISEAVRPKGTAVAALGWLWTVEGTFASLGAALGGFISEHYSPRYCLALTTVCVGIGYLIMRGGANLLKAADRIPTEEEATDALSANLNTNK
ncbi:MAG: MFS transporter [Candidatus Nanopelagicus sp.]|jgi:MFS family permease|nr:MFS transporter [Candidatus Nanopelagicus sp.]